MIYLLLALGAFAVLVWAGRRARPLLLRGDVRIAAGVTALVAFAGAGLAGAREAWVPAVVLLAIGGLSAMSARTPRGTPRVGAPETAGLEEARAILGVSASASAEEIQAAYVRLIRMAHPDLGGTSGLAAQLNAARDRLLKR